MSKTSIIDEKTIKQFRKAIHYTLNELKTFKEIGFKRSDIILTQDTLGKELSKKNQQKLDIYKKKLGHTNIDEKVTQIEEIIFRNFDINESNFEIIRAYIDEYFDRFIKLEKTITVTLLSLEKVVTDLSNKIESKSP
tara:strand:+ start:49 stop:459 length:411 start_codon:yes stop_codon:yes gene_type:complete